jgi:hypothetical protein
MVYKTKQKANYDAHYRVHDSLPIPDDTEVWVTTGTSWYVAPLGVGPGHHDRTMWKFRQEIYATTGDTFAWFHSLHRSQL